MQTCYLTCGFVNLLCSADACSPLTEFWVAGVMMSAHSVAVLEAGARRASKSPKTIISRLDPAKRLEAYLAAEGVPLEDEASVASRPPSATAPSLSAKWKTLRPFGVLHLAAARATPSAKSGRSARCCSTGWGSRCSRSDNSRSFLRCLGTRPYRDRVTPHS